MILCMLAYLCFHNAADALAHSGKFQSHRLQMQSRLHGGLGRRSVHDVWYRQVQGYRLQGYRWPSSMHIVPECNVVGSTRQHKPRYLCSVSCRLYLQ